MATWIEKEAAIRALERNGKVDPLDLIEAAKAKKHSVPQRFPTWDLKKAASERWRDQARELIRRVVFEFQVEDTTERTVQYVPNDGEDHKFYSLPKIRSKSKVSLVLLAEVKMFHGLASRVYGIASAKQGLVGADVVATLGVIRDQIAELKAGME